MTNPGDGVSDLASYKLNIAIEEKCPLEFSIKVDRVGQRAQMSQTDSSWENNPGKEGIIFLLTRRLIKYHQTAWDPSILKNPALHRTHRARGGLGPSAVADAKRLWCRCFIINISDCTV